ncbi:hypothetical protein [Chthonobacter albigriseus]|uniref:hypothetical protein n=1 Tax=Chthonobacter albigriseus TaxID=1683161 RepID=UPI0015EFAB7E|nr:hypothetical protein [Chthonobacter albigriseus]
MGLFDIFRRPPRIADSGALQDFLAEQTAFLVQKSTWEYSRARSGVLWQKLFKEAAFKEAIEASTWRNYPLGLAFVGEMAAVTLRGAGLDANVVVPVVAEAARNVVAAHPLPRGFDEGFWQEAAVFVTERLNRTLVAPPKAVKDIALDGHTQFFKRLPMHPELTRHDGPLLLSTLRINLCRAHETLLERLDAQQFAAALTAADTPVA